MFGRNYRNEQRKISAPKNEFDKSTIVSIFPQALHEKKWTLEPGIFDIPAGSLAAPATLIVGPSSWWKAIHDEGSLLEIPTGSAIIAHSVVNDFCNSVDLYNRERSSPGLFAIAGRALSREEVKKECATELKIADEKQRNWYKLLIDVGDMLWSHSNGNPRSVNDLARLAARELNVKNKPWMANDIAVTLINCVACGSLRNPNYPICQACHHIVDQELYKKLNLAKVG